MKENSLAYYVGWRKQDKRGFGKNAESKYLWTVQVAGAKRIKRFVDVVKPYLVIKREQAEVLSTWLEWVLIRPQNTKRNTQVGVSTNKHKYLETDRLVKAKISELNQNPQRLYAEHINKYIGDKSYNRQQVDIKT